MKVGDLVAIVDKSNRYLESQKIGDYVKNHTTGEIWVGDVKKIVGDRALVGGGWRCLDHYEVIYSSK